MPQLTEAAKGESGDEERQADGAGEEQRGDLRAMPQLRPNGVWEDQQRIDNHAHQHQRGPGLSAERFFHLIKPLLASGEQLDPVDQTGMVHQRIELVVFGREEANAIGVAIRQNLSVRVDYRDLDQLVRFGHQSGQTRGQQRVAQGFAKGLLRLDVEGLGDVFAGDVAYQGGAPFGGVNLDLHDVAEIDCGDDSDNQGLERDRAQRQLGLEIHAPFFIRP